MWFSISFKGKLEYQNREDLQIIFMKVDLK